MYIDSIIYFLKYVAEYFLSGLLLLVTLICGGSCYTGAWPSSCVREGPQETPKAEWVNLCC